MASKTKKSWAEIINMPIGQLPRVPVDVLTGTTAAVVTNFMQLYGAYAIDFMLTNLDGAAALTYQLNSPQATPVTLAAGAQIAFSNVLLESIRIVGNGATGNWELLAFVLPRELLYKGI